MFTFVKEFESIDFPEAVKRLADRAKIPLDFEKGPGQQQSRHLKETLLQIHEQITQRWQHALANDAAGQIARDYLAKRGLSEEAIRLFRLGYAPEAWDDTVNWARSKDYELPVVEQAGLILRKEGTDRYYDRFRGRLIFPICDEQGRVIGFSGRVLSGDEKAAKYVNSPETPIFTKGKVFFGLDKSKRAILDAGFAIICEGQLDLIACFMAGIKNIVAPQGTALTADHTRILKRYVEEVVLCFDSDNAGQAAAVRSLDSLLASDLAIRVVTVPAPHDPDSFIKESGGTAFQQLIEKAEGFFDFYLNQLCATHDVATDKGRHAVVKHMAEAVHKTNNQVLTDKYAQKAALRLAVSPESVRAEFKKISRPTLATEEPDETPAADEATPRPSLQEFWLLKLLLLSDEHIDWVAAHLNLNWVSHPVVRQIVSTRLTAHRQHTWQGVAALLAELESEAARSLVTEASTDERPIPDPEKTLKGDGNIKGTLFNLREAHIKRELAFLKRDLDKVDLPEAERLDLLRRQLELGQLKQQPLLPLAGPSATTVAN